MYLWIHQLPGFLYQQLQSSERCRWAPSSAQYSGRDTHEPWWLGWRLERRERTTTVNWFLHGWNTEILSKLAKIRPHSDNTMLSHNVICVCKGKSWSEARTPFLSLFRICCNTQTCQQQCFHFLRRWYWVFIFILKNALKMSNHLTPENKPLPGCIPFHVQRDIFLHCTWI